MERAVRNLNNPSLARHEEGVGRSLGALILDLAHGLALATAGRVSLPSEQLSSGVTGQAVGALIRVTTDSRDQRFTGTEVRVAACVGRGARRKPDPIAERGATDRAGLGLRPASGLVGRQTLFRALGVQPSPRLNTGRRHRALIAFATHPDNQFGARPIASNRRFRTSTPSLEHLPRRHHDTVPNDDRRAIVEPVNAVPEGPHAVTIIAQCASRIGIDPEPSPAFERALPGTNRVGQQDGQRRRTRQKPPNRDRSPTPWGVSSRDCRDPAARHRRAQLRWCRSQMPRRANASLRQSRRRPRGCGTWGRPAKRRQHRSGRRPAS